MTIEVLSEFYEVDHHADGASALKQALSKGFDVMVFDRRMPSMDGVSLLQAIRTARITTPVLLLTALDAVDDRVAGLDAGANDYLVKPFAYEELLARLRTLRRGYEAIGKRRPIGEWTLMPETQALYSPTELRYALTETETALLEALAASPERIFSREELLESVFTDASGVSSVDTYVHYLRRKTVPEIVETVRGRGYRLGAPE
ncbi:response regulator transcription factor [Leucobacter insecticola]|uniref:Response regulator transcription factor n=2 Tax=Leucobacter insecticola TaxID=2714934 RepID=A0A6G8FLL6_9MICO|nr:response regulator transcription factor [Leucobacter insecticola]